MAITRPSMNAGMTQINTMIKNVQKWIMDTIDYTLNKIFELSHTMAGTRSSALFIILIALVGVIIITSRSSEDWGYLFSNFLLVSSGQPLPEDVSVSSAFTDLLGAILFNPLVWGRVLALIAPFWLMRHITAIYLADVFEKDEEVAYRFISQAAFASEYGTIRIREGKIVEADQGSPIVQIGGPGYVVVELDSAVLFEKPNGTPHVIPPTANEYRGKKVVDGFERIRQAADLRDIMGNYEMSARSRDGIPVVGKDIQYTYSIYRGENPVKSLKTPYPFDEKALISLVYKAARTVKAGVAPSTKPDWLQPLPGKLGGSIQTELGGFVSKRGLSEFLSSIGEPERDALRNLEEKLDRDGQQLSGRNGNQAYEDSISATQFTSRASITAMFYNESFKKTLMNKGFQVNWIGVGTWVTPAEIIPANHLEAWKLSRENATRNNPDQLRRLREESYLQEGLRLVQTMPIGQFYSELKNADDEIVIDALIGDYYERIQSAVELYERDGQELPTTLLEALHVLNDVRGTSHRWINDM